MCIYWSITEEVDRSLGGPKSGVPEYDRTLDLTNFTLNHIAYRGDAVLLNCWTKTMKVWLSQWFTKALHKSLQSNVISHCQVKHFLILENPLITVSRLTRSFKWQLSNFIPFPGRILFKVFVYIKLSNKSSNVTLNLKANILDFLKSVAQVFKRKLWTQ